MLNDEQQREMDRNLGQNLLKLEGEALEKFIDGQEFLRRNLKQGENVIHLQYIGLLIPTDHVLELEKELQANNLALSYYDDSNSMKASAIELISSVVINAQITNWILGNVAWEVVWNFLLKILTITFDKINEIRSKNPDYLKNRQTGVGITFEIANENDKESVNFSIPADADPKVVREARKMMEVILKLHAKGSRYEQWDLDEDGNWKRDHGYDVPND